MVGSLARKAIVDGLGITNTNLYKTIKSIDKDIIVLYDGRKFKLNLELIDLK